MPDNFNALTFDLRDEFNRKSVAGSVISLLVEDVEVSPLIIDGGWGTGKTEFCHKLINLFRSEYSNYKQIYIDAFKADHADQPLMTILSAILKELPDDEVKQKIIKKALPALRFGVKTGLKAGLGWVLKQDTDLLSEEFDKEVKKVGEKVIDSSVESLLKEHSKADESIAALKGVLQDLADDQPIVIYVDELDRCRPNYAISILENIKHVFDVPNVQFVLVTNTVQLKASINHCYGIGVNAQRYLDKFIGFSFVLPNQSGAERDLVSIKHYRNLVANSSVLCDCRLLEGACYEFVEGLIRCNRLSLREVETFVKRLSIFHVISGSIALRTDRVFGIRLLRIFGVFLNSFQPERVDELTHGIVNAPYLMKLLGYGQPPHWNDDLHRMPFEASIAMMIAFESTVDIDSFFVDAELSEKWERSIQDLFPLMGWKPQRGERVEHIVKAINSMQLA